MHLLKAIPLGLIATLLTATAAPRIATVRVRDIYTELPSTTKLQEEIKAEREKIMQTPQAEELRKTLSELQALQSRLSQRQNQIDDEMSRSLTRMYEVKRQEAQTLQEAFETYRTEAQARISRKMVDGMRASLTKIVSVATKIGQERGFDSVFDSSGNTNTGLPFIVYVKNAPDLTADVQAALKDLEPATPPPSAPETAPAEIN